MHPAITILILGIIGFTLLNILAYRHAHAMLHFTDSGARTDSPESLSLLRKAKTLVSGVNIPRPVNDTDPGILAAPTLADLDPPETESSLEIIVAALDGHVYVWNADGSQRRG